MKLHIEIMGQGKPLAFMHGWGFNRTIWHSISKSLVNHYQLILIDLPGFGLSEYCNYNLDSVSDYLACHLPNPVTMIGWSLGGVFASHYAIKYNQLVSHLVNIASSPYFMQQNNWPGVSHIFFKRFCQQLKMNFNKTMNDFLRLQLPDSSVNQFDDIFTPNPHPFALDNGLLILEKTDLRNDIANLGIPCHYLFGRLDKLVPITLKAKIDAHYRNIHTYCFELSAHMPFISEKDDFTAYIKREIR
jgi:pimeloyl-[acyl-carrier protein] methyl ester esterase